MAVALPAILAAAGGVGTAATVATGATALGTVLSVGSAAIGAVGAFQQSRFNSQVALNNAQIAEDNAQRAIFESQIQAQESDVAARGELGFILAQAGASGLSADEGSIATRRRSQQQLAAKDRGLIRNQGDVEAARSRQQAADFRSQAKQERRAGNFELIGGSIDIGTSLVSGAAQINRRKAQKIVR